MTSVHLCQPDSSKSCAACCGIYNYVHNTRQELEYRLRYRTKLFDLVRRGDIDIGTYRNAIRHREDQKRIYKTIYTCEFVGFLDKRESRVGCMLHPMQNNGYDLREISFYGKGLCETHLCPSYYKLTQEEARVVVSVIDNWYLYGVVITDIDFVKALFRILQERIADAIDPVIVNSSYSLKSAFMRYFRLKESWPYKDTSRPRFGKYFFVGEDYDIAKIDYESIGAKRSPYDAILVSLSSEFRDKDTLDSANRMIDMIMDDLSTEYTKAYRKHNRDCT